MTSAKPLSNWGRCVICKKKVWDSNYEKEIKRAWKANEEMRDLQLKANARAEAAEKKLAEMTKYHDELEAGLNFCDAEKTKAEARVLELEVQLTGARAIAKYEKDKTEARVRERAIYDKMINRLMEREQEALSRAEAAEAKAKEYLDAWKEKKKAWKQMEAWKNACRAAQLKAEARVRELEEQMTCLYPKREYQ